MTDKRPMTADEIQAMSDYLVDHYARERAAAELASPARLSAELAARQDADMARSFSMTPERYAARKAEIAQQTPRAPEPIGADGLNDSERGIAHAARMTADQWLARKSETNKLKGGK